MDENNKADKKGILEFIKNNKILLAILFFVVFIFSTYYKYNTSIFSIIYF